MPGSPERMLPAGRGRDNEPMEPGVLVLAATPIGDSRDASPRLATELQDADVVAAEDTRRVRRLCAALGVTRSQPVVSYHDHNEATRTGELLERLRAGARVVVVTDAGMPSVSDPGYRLVTAAIAAGILVTCVPGPSAVLAALAVSGLPVERFSFEGFLPRRAEQRRRALAALAAEPRTMVFFEAPHRLGAMLADAAQALGAGRRAAVCRELTKQHEQVHRGTLAELAEWATGDVRGEVTVVVAGAGPSAGDLQEAVAGILRRVAEGERLRDVVAEVAAATGLRRKALYDAAVARRRP